MTDCEKITELLSAYYDGELTDSECELVRAHLDECESCAALLRLFRGVTDAFSEIEPPPELRERVMKSVREVSRRRTANTKRIILWRVIPAAACLAVVLLALPLLVNSGKSDNVSMTGGAMVSGADTAVTENAAMLREGAVDEYAYDEFDAGQDASGGAGVDESESGEARIMTDDANTGSTSGAAVETPEAAPTSTPEPEQTYAGEPPAGAGAHQYGVTPEDGAADKTHTELDEYYAVIKVIGEFPRTLLDKLNEDQPISYDANTREQRIVVTRDIAEALIDEGYDYALYNGDAEEALVIAVPDGQ